MSRMRRWLTLSRDDQRGAAAVEFALVSGILFMLVFGIIAFGQFYSQYQVFQGAAREGARVASVRAPTTDVRDRVVDSSRPYDVSEPATVAVDGGGGQCGDATVGRRVVVSWDQLFSISLPLVPEIDTALEIRGVFRCE